MRRKHALRKIIFGINLILLLGISGFGQNNSGSGANDAPAPQTKHGIKSEKSAKSNDQSPKGSIANGENVLLQTGTTLEGELQSTLDARKTKIGDEVVLKTTKRIRQNGEVVVPKGTKLVGRVTEVQEKTKNAAMSKIGVIFNQLEGKNLSAPISASVISISQIAASANAASVFDSDIAGSASSSGNVSGRSNSGGGLLGGVSNTVGGVLNTAANSVGGVTNTAGQTLGGAARTVGNTVNGISISQSGSASAQGATTLSAEDKNIRLEKGVLFRLQLNQSIEN
jgi:hypothetical protein